MPNGNHEVPSHADYHKWEKDTRRRAEAAAKAKPEAKRWVGEHLPLPIEKTADGRFRPVKLDLPVHPNGFLAGHYVVQLLSGNLLFISNKHGRWDVSLLIKEENMVVDINLESE